MRNLIIRYMMKLTVAAPSTTTRSIAIHTATRTSSGLLRALTARDSCTALTLSSTNTSSCLGLSKSIMVRLMLSRATPTTHHIASTIGHADTSI